MAATFSENIAAALRQIALDQIAQDLEIQQTYATKDELNNLGGGQRNGCCDRTDDQVLQRLHGHIA